MLPEVEEYFRTVERVANAANDRRNPVREAAWTLLDAVTENKLVEWITANYDCDDEGVETVLRELPLTVTELRALGKRHGWCDDFDSALANAIEAGVIEEELPADPTAAAWDALTAWVRTQLPGVTDGQLASLKERVGAVVDAALGSKPITPAEAAELASGNAAIERRTTDTSDELDIANWPEWTAISDAARAAGLTGAAGLQTVRSMVQAVALEARRNGVHTVEQSAPAQTLRNWVTNNAGERYVPQLRTLMEPLVRRAARH